MKTNSEHIKEIAKHLRTWIEIDTKAIDHNLACVRRAVPESAKIMAVVKSNAYGHGLFDFANYVAQHPTGAVSWIGVDSLAEAIALRKDGITLPILVMGYTLPERFSEAVSNDISITISNKEALQAAIDFGPQIIETHEDPFVSKVLKVHIKVDTGLHRQGFLPSEFDDLLSTLTENTAMIDVEGLYTHIADAKRPEGIEYSNNQKKIFDDIRDRFLKAGFQPLCHISASPCLMRFGKEWIGEGDVVRVGALLYGIYPAPGMEEEFATAFPLKPILSWKTILTELKSIPAGSPVGYNRSETVARDTLIGICPVGYWHGFPGVLSSKGVVMIGGHQAKVLGRVSMDALTVDCTDCPDAKVGDEVTVIDSDPQSPVSAQRVADMAQMSVHELLTRLNSRIKRIFL